MNAKQKYTLVAGIVLGLVVLGAILFLALHIRYNSSVDNDLKALTQLSSRNDTGKPLVNLDQLAMPDELRTREIDRGYTLKTSPTQVEVCGKEYQPVWQLSPRKAVCHSESVR